MQLRQSIYIVSPNDGLDNIKRKYITFTNNYMDAIAI